MPSLFPSLRSHFAGGVYTKRAIVAETQPIIQPKKMHQTNAMRWLDSVYARMLNRMPQAIAHPMA